MCDEAQDALLSVVVRDTRYLGTDPMFCCSGRESGTVPQCKHRAVGGVINSQQEGNER